MIFYTCICLLDLQWNLKPACIRYVSKVEDCFLWKMWLLSQHYLSCPRCIITAICLQSCNIRPLKFNLTLKDRLQELPMESWALNNRIWPLNNLHLLTQTPNSQEPILKSEAGKFDAFSLSLVPYTEEQLDHFFWPPSHPKLHVACKDETKVLWESIDWIKSKRDGLSF